MRSAAEVDSVLELAARGLTPSAIARDCGLPRATVRDWLAGRVPRSYGGEPADCCPGCGGRRHDFTALPTSYPYLLGMYLGDGCLSMHRRAVCRLRVHLDLKYPNIIEECKAAISDLLPDNRVHCQRQRSNYTGRPEMTSVVVSAYSKSWRCYLPQHGSGPKHLRPIILEPWQNLLVDAEPWLFLRGLIHSDGCRFINTGRNWRHPRYGFSNQSEDIHHLFDAACDRVSLHTTRSRHTTYVSRMADVALLDMHVGPKT